MKLIYYPNASLEKACESVTDFSNLKPIVEEMAKIMLEHNGLGLSSNQVGLNLRLFIMRDGKGQVQHFINPKLLGVEGLSRMNEGCLSAPGIYLEIDRPETIHIEYQNLEGETKQVVITGIEARCVLHEMEHLDGQFYFARVNRRARKEAISRLRKKVDG